MSVLQQFLDNLYSTEDRSHTPKEYFKLLTELTRKRAKPETGRLKLMDVGCASGDLLYFLHQCFPDAELSGMDISELLLQSARSKMSGVNYVVGNVDAAEFTPPGTYDVIYFAGVHMYLEGCERWVPNLCRMLNRNGMVLIFSLFNPFPYDVFVNIRKAGEKELCPWHCYSKETIAAEFEKYGFTSEFIPWQLPLELPMNRDNLLRTWTVPLKDGTTISTNATRIIHDFYCAVITRAG